MSNEEIVPGNPATLASKSAESIFTQPDEMKVFPEDYHILTMLETAAKELEFIDGQYFVETSRGLSIPASFTTGQQESVTFIDMYKLAFEGIFRGYSKVQIGKIVGIGPVNALCLTFEEVTLLPFFDNLPDDHIFHVPALAVDSIDQAS